MQWDPRREFLRKTLKAGLWTLAGTSGLLAPLVHAFGQMPKELPAGKSIYRIKGEVWVNGELADLDTFIPADAHIKTGRNAEIVFVVGKDAHILRANSDVQLSGSGLVQDGLRLVTGKLLSVFGERQDNEQTLTIKTTTATIGIRGTGVYCESRPDKTYFCTCYGRTQIQADADNASQEEIVSRHHDAPRYIFAKGQSGKLIRPAPMINHSDLELNLVEALVGRDLPFPAANSYSGPRRSY